MRAAGNVRGGALAIPSGQRAGYGGGVPRPLSLLCLLTLGACCQAPPQWTEIAPLTVGFGVDVPLTLSDHATGDHLTFSAEAEPGVTISQVGDVLHVTGEEGFDGYSTIRLAALDQCGQAVETSVSVRVSDRERSNGCLVSVSTKSTAASVMIAGDFNRWSSSETPMEKQPDGSFSVDLTLAPGAYAYKFVEGGAWRCDAEASMVQCKDGQEWTGDCPSGGNSCNSLLVVRECDTTEVTTTLVDIDRAGRSITVSGRADRPISEGWATLDGETISGWSDQEFHYNASGLAAGRHTLRFGADDSEPAYVPFWLDERDWSTGLLYFAFVDRFANGDPNLDGSELADVDYEGGDWKGLRERLPYLDDLGVTALWLTAPVDNAEGAFDGTCDTTYSGYHGYWPDGSALEEHFGDEAEFQALVDAAHDLNMRVLVDWVANHAHEDHDDWQTHPEWFNDRLICSADEDGDGQLNWDQRPETCWFTGYLPDYDYTQIEPLTRSVDAAIDLAKTYQLDGFRIDAVKHMPHSVFVNTQARIRAEIEHTDAGGTEDFRTIGETFDGAERIAGYLGEKELDAQFDFPLYWTVLATFARDEAGLSDGAGSLQASIASSNAAYGGAVMSTFLGNHDVSRFIAHASGEVAGFGGDSVCVDGGGLRAPDVAPTGSDPYARLRLAWSFLLTSPGLPLVYYGDEYGQPGYADPDNRQFMRFDNELSGNERATLAHVQALGLARREHPAFSRGETVDWWEGEADVWAYARVYQDDQVLVLLNRAEGDRTLANGLAFAGLPQGTWRDVLTGDSFASDGDRLSVAIPGRGSRVLVVQP